MATVTKTIGTTSRDYSTITLWEAALGGAAGGSGNDAIGQCYDDSAFDETVTINDATPDSITLTVPTAERHDGTAGSGARIVATSDQTKLIYANSTKPIVTEWIELDMNGRAWNSGTNYIYGADVSGTYPASYIKNCIVHGTHDGNGTDGGNCIGIWLDSHTGGALNTIVYDIICESTGTGTAKGVSVTTGLVLVTQNLTVHNTKCANNTSGNAEGIFWDNFDDAGDKIQNNISVGTATEGSGSADDFAITGSSGSEDHNLSSDATASGTGSLTSKTAANQFVSTTGGSEDLHLKTGADAIGAGTDLGTTPSGVEIDIDGRDRDSEGDTWDIGADQFVASATEVTPNAGTLTWTGNTPTTSKTATPAAGSIAWTGNTPTTSKTATPTAGSLAWTGNTPTATKTTQPAAGSLAWTGNTPATTAATTPQPGSLAWTGNTPTTSKSATPAAGSLQWTGTTPTVGQTTEPQPGSLAWTGHTPTTSKSATPAAGSLAWTGNTPATTAATTPQPGSLAWTGNTPTTSKRATPAAGSLTWAGRYPTTTHDPDGAARLPVIGVGV